MYDLRFLPNDGERNPGKKTNFHPSLITVNTVINAWTFIRVSAGWRGGGHLLRPFICSVSISYVNEAPAEVVTVGSTGGWLHNYRLGSQKQPTLSVEVIPTGVVPGRKSPRVTWACKKENPRAQPYICEPNITHEISIFVGIPNFDVP